MAWRAFTATSTIQKVLSYNPKRISASIENNGDADVAVSPDPIVVATQGWIIKIGGSITLVKSEGDEPEADLYAVSTSGSQNLRIQESLGVP